jgi:hypothetical protein
LTGLISLLSDFVCRPLLQANDVLEVNHAHDEQQRSRRNGKAFARERPLHRSQMKTTGGRLIRQASAQAKVEIGWRFHCTQTADDLAQLCLPLVKLTTVCAIAQMLGCTYAALIRQL